MLIGGQSVEQVEALAYAYEDIRQSIALVKHQYQSVVRVEVEAP